MNFRWLVVASALLLHACTTTYTPEVWPIREGKVPHFDVSGNISIVNGQPSTEPTIVYAFSGHKLDATYKSITAMMANEARLALQNNGAAAPSDKYKKIALKVTMLRSHYIAWSWKSTMEFEIRLGNGEVITKKVGHGAGPDPFSPGMVRDLNGCIAEGVIALFNDDKVKAYLAM